MLNILVTLVLGIVYFWSLDFAHSQILDLILCSLACFDRARGFKTTLSPLSSDTTYSPSRLWSTFGVNLETKYPPEFGGKMAEL